MCYRQLITFGELSRPCKFVIDFIKPNAKVLEIGCATGYMTKELRNKGCEVTCIEIDQELARKAEEFSKEMIVGDIEDPSALKNINNRFDYILLMDVLEHLRNPQNVLLAVKNYLAEKGVVIANIPNIAFYTNRIEIIKGKFEYQEYGFFDTGHLRFYTYKTSQALLTNAGYKIVKDIPFLYFPWEIKIKRIPLLGKLLLKMTAFIKHKYPNLFGFSFTYVVRPNVL
jgi:2-polyprenyl-3-methyl-5-hydroxy-6-metoxy-1,4-benzoquinol methylase